MSLSASVLLEITTALHGEATLGEALHQTESELFVFLICALGLSLLIRRRLLPW